MIFFFCQENLCRIFQAKGLGMCLLNMFSRAEKPPILLCQFQKSFFTCSSEGGGGIRIFQLIIKDFSNTSQTYCVANPLKFTQPGIKGNHCQRILGLSMPAQVRFQDSVLQIVWVKAYSQSLQLFLNRPSEVALKSLNKLEHCVGVL